VNLILEAKVQQPVSLIQDKKFQVIKVDAGRVGDVVNQPSRGGNYNIRPGPKLRCLLS